MTSATKCGLTSCKCPIPPDRPFGDFCSDYCLDAAHTDAAPCQCGHADCSGEVEVGEVLPDVLAN